MPKYDTIIRNGSVVREGGVEVADVAIDGGKFVEIGPQLSGEARETIDATGLHVFPGVIDPHVHFNEPGRTEWEGFATGSAALAAGGGTCFFDMPLNSSPPVLDGESFDLKLAAASAKSVTDFALWGGLTPNNLDKLEELADRGVIGFKAFMCNSGIDDFPASDDRTLFEGMKKIASLGLLLAVHAESEAITSSHTAQFRARGTSTWQDYVDSRPLAAELEAIQRAIMLAAEAGCPLHIVHVSAGPAVEWVHQIGRSIEANVTCETCPHYLECTEGDFPRLGATIKCAPPLRDDVSRQDLWKKVAAGDVAFIASDHSPAPPHMKEAQDPFDAWGGVAGIQSTLEILLSERPALALPLVARLTSSAAADRFRVRNKGNLKCGLDGDVTLVDMNRRVQLTRADLLDRHKLSPYVGRTFQGLMRRTIVRGTTVFLDGKIVSQPLGRLVKPA